MQEVSRRAFVSACGVSLTLGAGCLGDSDDPDEEPSSRGGSAWTSFRGTSFNTAAVDGDGPREPAAQWTVEGSSNPATAVIADGTAYLAAGSTLEAVALSDGDERWTVDLEGERTGSPAVTDQEILCPIESGLVVVDLAGEERQRIPFDGSDPNATLLAHQQSQPSVSSSPTVVDGTAYVGTPDEEVVAIDLADGDVAWRTPVTEGWTAMSQERQTTGVVSSPAVADGRVVTGTAEGVAAFDTTDGSSLWTHGTERAVQSSPAVVDGTVYVGGSEPVALAADSGDVRWGNGETVESMSGSRAGSGRWNGTLTRQEQPMMTPSVAVGDDLVVAHEPDDRLVARDRNDGEVQWDASFDRIESLSSTGSTTARVESAGIQVAPSWSSPAIAGDVVIVGTFEGVVAVSLESGEGLWRFPTGSRVVASPAVADGTVVVGDGSGTVYALADE